MNDHREFDELARQKLAERQFAFQEGDWADMQRLINDQGKKRRWPLWTLAAVLLVATPALWWALREEPATIAPVPPKQATAEVAAVEAASQQVSASSSMATEHTEMVITEQAIDAKAPATAVAATAQGPVQQTNDRKTEEHVNRANEAHSIRITSNVHTQTPSATSTAHVNGSTTTDLRATSVAQVELPADQNAKSGTEGQSTVNMSEAAAVPVTTSTTDGAPAHDADPKTSASSTSDATAPANSSSAESTPVVPPIKAEVPASADSTATTTTVQDSSLVPAPPAATNWLATAGSHFEFSLLGGMSLSTSRYTSTSAETWRTDNSGQWSPSFGFEAMRMKEHFGYGLGMHRARYEEQLRAEQLSRTDDIYTTTYFLMPVQIITPVVTDTLTVDSVDYFMTTPTTVTVNQLISDTDTSQQSVMLREARTVVNRVDYWEVPLLVDLHTSKGRWCFGVRGGPSIGFLSVRSGVVPNAEGDGYADLGGSTYRSTLFGYQARIYARYRLSDRWSIGLEPVARGHFGNAFEGGSPVRRNMAVGGLFSLTFRLP
jgi:hypothetical protein